jgi:putative membrane protein
MMQPRKTKAVLLIAMLAQNGSVRADVIWQSGITPRNIWNNWGLDPGVIIGLFGIAIFYFAGLARFWGNGHFGRGVRPRGAVAFAAGWVALLIALVSPLHPLGSALFSAHMIQHEVLMVFAAPLLVLGKPIPVLLGALPRSLLRWTLKLRNYPTVRSISERCLNPLIAWVIHAVALWAWHAPALFQASLKSNLVHAVQHASFLGSALLFWAATFPASKRPVNYGVGVLYMFTTALQSGALGALLTIARTPWYPIYITTTSAWGLSPLEDQQLGGLIMWIPAGVVYIVAGLVCFALWLKQSERRLASLAPVLIK